MRGAMGHKGKRKKCIDEGNEERREKSKYEYKCGRQKGSKEGSEDRRE